MNGNKPNWCFIDGKVPIFIDKSEDAKFPILTNGRRYKKDSREWLHKTSNNRGKNRKRTVDSKSDALEDHKLEVNVESLSDTMEIAKNTGGSSSTLNFSGRNIDMGKQKEHDIRLSPFQCFGRDEDRELAVNQIAIRSCIARGESSRRLRKRRLTWLKAEKNDSYCIEVNGENNFQPDHDRFRPIPEVAELEAIEFLDPVAGKSHEDVNGHSLEISASFWFDTDDSTDGTWWRETKPSSSDSSLEDFCPGLDESACPIDPTLIRSPVPRKRGADSESDRNPRRIEDATEQRGYGGVINTVGDHLVWNSYSEKLTLLSEEIDHERQEKTGSPTEEFGSRSLTSPKDDPRVEPS
ncbi:uncharacterized protein LOC132551054 [Ylistrum balloti]|uniref:uncharacterized protein LOC132551054 n=1 Tax=Ylistrum balloti TaxID=509963 RepID=UPI002905C6D4|nr:uncharacterized protein LOC132551054 [Ylistrum balloti]